MPQPGDVLLNLTIPGRPQPKERPQFGKGRTFTRKRTDSYESVVRFMAAAAIQGAPPFDGAVELAVHYYRAVPRSESKVRQRAMLSGPAPTKPDADNLAKTLMDALNGTVWKDDSQVTRLVIEKRWAVDESVVLEVRAR